MISYLKKYWLEILTFGAIFAILLMCCSPGLTWINTDSDGAHYLLAAKYMLPAHNTSAPLFLLIGRLFLYLPFGTEALRLGLISVISTTVCSILIYKTVVALLLRSFIQKYPLSINRKNKNYESDSNEKLRRIYGLIAALVYGGSVLVISQSTIIESYALATMLAVLAYYLSLKRKWLLVSMVIGLIWATHTIFAWSTWIVLLMQNKELRNIPLAVVTLLFLSFYAYIPIVTAINGDIGMWNNTTLQGFFEGQWGVLWMLTGGIALVDMPKRILDTLAMLGVSMGLSLIVMVYGLFKHRKGYYALIALTLFPIIYFVTNLSAETYVYMMPAIAFGSIYSAIVLSKVSKKIVYATAIVAIILTSINAWYMDIGRTLDPNLSAQKYYDEELPKLKDGDIFLGGGWTWAINYLYNKEEGAHIVPVCTDILPSSKYLDSIEASGIKLERTDSDSFIDKQWLVAKSIAELNDNVWIAKETNPKTLEYELVPAKDNMYLIERWLGYENESTIAWKPSNPYEFITGALEVGEWKFILKSNHNARLAIIWSIYGIAFMTVLNKFKRKKKNEIAQTQE